MSFEYSADDAIDSSDEDHGDFLLTNSLPFPNRTHPASLPTTDKPNVWERCPLSPKGDQIRLLKLYPLDERSDNNLEAHLTVRKDDEPYEALSYTWGSSGSMSSIGIWSDSGEFEEIHIQGNLASALRQLRRERKPRTLWIDAICIDQDNLEEKNHQVPKMATIYNGARRVCVWLGEGGAGTERALNFVKRILHLDSFDRLVEDANSAEDWYSLWELMNSPWFSRRWVIQEIALARQAYVYCGKAPPVHWGDLCSAIAIFTSRYHQIRELLKVSAVFGRHFYRLDDVIGLAAERLVDGLSDLFRKSEDGVIMQYRFSLEYLVSTLSAFQATNPRDTIYAVLSLAEDTGTIFSARPSARIPVDVNNPGKNIEQYSDKEKQMLQDVMIVWRKRVNKPYPVDYDKSFFEVCKDFLEFTIENSQSLDMICRPWAPVPLTYDEKLPSWIRTVHDAAYRPGANRFHSRINADSLVGVPGTGKGNYNAAGSYPSKRTWRIGKSGTPEDRSLFVGGFILGSINEKALPAQQGNIPESWLKLGNWKDASNLPPSAFWRTIVADRGPNGKNTPPYYRFACWQAGEQRAADTGIDTEFLVTVYNSNRHGKESFLAEYLRRVQSVVWGRVLIRMTIGASDDYLGLASQSVKEGDLICIVFGCSVPVVLRPFFVRDESYARYYEFNGECYIHGMMDGEAFRILQEMNIEKMEFELR
jgi:hypothetical protein